MGENDYGQPEGNPHEDPDGSADAPKPGSLVFETPDGKRIIVPPEATTSQKHKEQNFRLTAQELAEKYVPRGFGFHRGMEELAEERKRLQAAATLAESIGEDQPWVEEFLKFKRERLEQLGPDELAYLRRYFQGDPDMAFTRRGASRHMGAGNQDSGEYDDWNDWNDQDDSHASHRQAQPQVPPELMSFISDLKRGLDKLEAKDQERQAAEEKRTQKEQWDRLKGQIEDAIGKDPILKREGNAAAKQILYDVYNTTEGDVELAIKLARQDAETRQKALLEEHLGEKIENLRRFGDQLPGGGTPPTSLPPVDIASYGKRPFKNPQFRKDSKEALKEAFRSQRGQ